MNKAKGYTKLPDSRNTLPLHENPYLNSGVAYVSQTGTFNFISISFHFNLNSRIFLLS